MVPSRTDDPRERLGAFAALEDAPGIHRHRFERAEIVQLAGAVGFVDARTASAVTIERDGRPYPLFLLTATRP